MTTAALAIPNPVDLITKAHSLAQRVHDAPMQTREHASELSDAKKSIRALSKKIEDDREQIIRPLLDTVARVKAKYEPALTDCKAALRECDTRLLEFAQAEARRVEEARAESMRKLQEEIAAREALESQAVAIAAKADEAGDSDTAAAIIESVLAVPEPVAERIMAAAPLRGEFGSVSSIRRNWTWQLDDARLLPREYLIPDEKAINGAIRDGAREIPGLRIFQRESISTR